MRCVRVWAFSTEIELASSFDQHLIFLSLHCLIDDFRSFYALLFVCRCADVGYCQGMAFVAGLLLTYMPELDAFWTLIALLKQVRLMS